MISGYSDVYNYPFTTFSTAFTFQDSLGLKSSNISFNSTCRYSFLSRHSLRQFRNRYCRMKFNSRNDILLTFRKLNQFFFPDIFKIFPDIYHDIIIHRPFILFYLSLKIFDMFLKHERLEW